MAFADERDYFAPYVLVLTCLSSALLGLVIGVLLSGEILERSEVKTPAYVQRASIPPHPEEALARALISSRGELAIAEELPSLSGSSATDLADAVGVPDVADEAGMPAQATVLPDGQTLLRINFDLGEASTLSEELEISKPIRLNGRALGVASLSIDQQSRLHVSSQDLSDLLPADLFARIDTGTNYIGFDDLRAGGLDVRYDPVTDVIEIVS